jgi:hypothetical protein
MLKRIAFRKPHRVLIRMNRLGWWSRFAQPDPYDGSYEFANPQSFNRYAYVQNDPVNFTDPSGLDDVIRNLHLCSKLGFVAGFFE